MHRITLPKKLLPLRRAWKRFTTTLQCNLRKLKHSKPIECTSTRLAALRPLLSSLSFKRNPFTRCSVNFSRGGHAKYSNVRYFHHHNRHSAQIQEGSATIYIDELFAESNVARSKPFSGQAGSSRPGKGLMEEEVEEGKEQEPYSIEDAWRNVVARSPHLRVDERADEFISKMKEDMRLQKERSLLEYQDMLARSA